ncbi:MarR family transcriptional regulator [Bacillus sp. BRMEA1]|uniref:MarR family winged helix-turn-helix transcriptional regulator n=1 Tax=Neobacillus endophyticus TaxID=2738405 RepID=UPI001564F579|nr:MarR family transcriptional regulator [Neobacillus endophyticus]NRD80868.1 MarR family transcriptional regulator [Neobacillus endophyticus]
MEIELNKQAVLTIRGLYFCIVEQWACINKVHGISSAQQHLLFILSTHEKPLTISEISNLGCWHLSTVSRLLQPLIRENFVTVQKCKTKYKYVSITNQGFEKLKEIAKQVFPLKEFPFDFSDIEQEEVQIFIEIGLKILKNFKGEEFLTWVKKPHFQEYQSS